MEFEQWQSNKNVSANLDHTAIGPVSAPIQVKRMGCAKSATRRGGQQKPILMGRRDRYVPNQKGADRSRRPFFVEPELLRCDRIETLFSVVLHRGDGLVLTVGVPGVDAGLIEVARP